jgi:CRISPR-associated protein Cmr1
VSATSDRLPKPRRARLPRPPKGQAFEHAFPGWFRERYENSATDLPEWTAISQHTRILLLRKESSESALSLLDCIGKEMMRYRSWGATQLGSQGRGMIFKGAYSEQNFKPDHDLMKQPFRKRNTHPARIAFGLPHNYGKAAHEKVSPAGRDLDRRASPLFLHIHQTDEQSPPIAVVSFLPARFLPGERPGISVGGTDVAMRPESELYEPVRRFLTRLAGDGHADLPGSKPTDPFTVIATIGMNDGGQP